MTVPAEPDLNADEIQVGTANGPGIYLAPEGTAPPTDTFSDWPDPWKSLGYLSDDGPTVASSIDTESIKPWQSRSPVRTVITGRGMTLQFIMWELNETTLGLYFDADAPVPDANGMIKTQVRTDQPQHLYAIGIDTADGDRCLRIAFKRASLSDAGDMAITAGSAVPLDVTLSALDDNGVLADLLIGPREDPTTPLTAQAPAQAAVPAQRKPAAEPAGVGAGGM